MVTESIKETTSNRPYPPPSNVISVLKRLRERNLPDCLDTEYLRDSAIPEGTITRTLFGLRFLGLINEQREPTQSLKSIHTSTNEEYQKILSGLVRESYKDVFNIVDPSKDSKDSIENVFRRFTPASQRVRMVIFFLEMCREAGIPTLDIPKARSMITKSGKSTMKRSNGKSEDSSSMGKGRASRISSPGVHPALDSLIRSLPQNGQSLSPERLQQWLDMAKATLRFIYPEKEASIKENGETESV